MYRLGVSVSSMSVGGGTCLRFGNWLWQQCVQLCSRVRAIAGTIATLPTRVLVWRNQITRIAEGKASLTGELFGSSADQQDMRTGKHGARNLYRILDMFDARDGANIEGCAIHDTAVQLNAPITGQHSAGARVESRIIFERGDRRLDGIERRAAIGQNTPASFRRGPATLARRLVAIRRNESRAAMNNDCSSHRAITSSSITRMRTSAFASNYRYGLPILAR